MLSSSFSESPEVLPDSKAQFLIRRKHIKGHSQFNMFSADPNEAVVLCVIPDERQSKELPGGPPRHWIWDILSNKVQLRECSRSMSDDKIRGKELACSRGPSKGRDGEETQPVYTLSSIRARSGSPTIFYFTWGVQWRLPGVSVSLSLLFPFQEWWSAALWEDLAPYWSSAPDNRLAVGLWIFTLTSFFNVAFSTSDGFRFGLKINLPCSDSPTYKGWVSWPLLSLGMFWLLLTDQY